MKKLAVLGLAAALSVSWTVPALAGQWIQDVNRAENSGGISNWWYRNDDGSYPAGGWYWIDGNGDGQAESYRFDGGGWMYASTTVDGYAVDESGAWLENGVAARRDVTPGFAGTQIDGSGTGNGASAGNGASSQENAGVRNQWINDGYGRRYYDAGGKLSTGWKRISGNRYYFDESGYALTGLQEIEGSEYYFYEDGELAETTVHASEDGVYYVVDKEEHYIVDVIDEEDWSEYRREADRDSVEVSEITDENRNQESGYQDDADSDEEGWDDAYAMECFDLINEEREERGLDPLELNEDIMEACQIRAEELPELFSHTRPDGSSCFTALEGAGIDGYSYVGENIAAGQRTPEAAVDSWMNSSGHKANILNENFTEAAIGCYRDPDSTYRIYWVQLFYRP